MKRKQTSKVLRISKETIKLLDPTQSVKVVGGRKGGLSIDKPCVPSWDGPCRG